MKVAVLGTGMVAQSLATGFVKNGHETIIGARNPSKIADWLTSNNLKSLSIEDAVKWSEVVVLAVKGSAAAQVIEGLGDTALAGKIVIDPTNPIADEAPENGVLKYTTASPNHSLMEQLQALAPSAQFVKAFSMIGAPHMVDPQFAHKPGMFICGNSQTAKEVVKGICESFGFEVEDFGSVTSSRAIEPLAMLWCIPGLNGGSWAHAFKLLK